MEEVEETVAEVDGTRRVEREEVEEVAVIVKDECQVGRRVLVAASVVHCLNAPKRRMLAANDSQLLE